MAFQCILGKLLSMAYKVLQDLTPAKLYSLLSDQISVWTFIPAMTLLEVPSKQQIISQFLLLYAVSAASNIIPF